MAKEPTYLVVYEGHLVNGDGQHDDHNEEQERGRDKQKSFETSSTLPSGRGEGGGLMTATGGLVRGRA